MATKKTTGKKPTTKKVNTTKEKENKVLNEVNTEVNTDTGDNNLVDNIIESIEKTDTNIIDGNEVNNDAEDFNVDEITALTDASETIDKMQETMNNTILENKDNPEHIKEVVETQLKHLDSIEKQIDNIVKDSPAKKRYTTDIWNGMITF